MTAQATRMARRDGPPGFTRGPPAVGRCGPRVFLLPSNTLVIAEGTVSSDATIRPVSVAYIPHSVLVPPSGNGRAFLSDQKSVYDARHLSVRIVFRDAERVSS